MPKPKTGFARRAEFFDRIAADPNLSRAAIVVAWRLINHINDETGECFPSLERLAGQLHIHTRTVRRGVDHLVTAGWFTKARRGRGGTAYFANYANRAELSEKPDNAVKKNRTELSTEPKGEPFIEPQGSPPLVPPDLLDDCDRPARRNVTVADDRSNVGKAIEFWNTMAAENGLPQVQRIT